MTHQEQQALLAYRRLKDLTIRKVESEIDLIEITLKLPPTHGMEKAYKYRKKELEELLNIIKNDK